MSDTNLPTPVPEAHTRARSVRIPDGDWADLGTHGDRGSLIRRLTVVYLHDDALRARVDVMPDPVGQRRHDNLHRPVTEWVHTYDHSLCDDPGARDEGLCGHGFRVHEVYTEGSQA